MTTEKYTRNLDLSDLFLQDLDLSSAQVFSHLPLI